MRFEAKVGDSLPPHPRAAATARDLRPPFTPSACVRRAQISQLWSPSLWITTGAAPMELERVRAGGAVSGVRGGPDGG